MYNDDLAYIQREGFADFAAQAGPDILRLLRQSGITSGHVLDLGCGDGAWLRQLTLHGFSATGIEQSATLAKYARAAAPRAAVRVGSVHRTVFPPCDAITALGEVLSYLPNSRRAPALARVFTRAYRALPPGGLFIFDLLVAGPRMGYHVWRAGPTWAVLAHVHDDSTKRRLIRDIITFRKVGGSYRRAHERHVLAATEPRAVLTELRRAGFVASTSARYGRFQLPVRRRVFIARKP